MPKATKERIDAHVYKRIYELQHNAQEPDDPELTLKPNLSKTLQATKHKKYYHNGKWEQNKFDGEESWSCCMNSDKESEGCVGVIVDKDKWILSSYT